MQAYLRDTVGSVPDNHNKASHKKFCFLSTNKSYIYIILSSIKCAIPYLKQQCTRLNLKYFIDKKKG